MGKVLSVYTNGWPGSIARALDDVVVSQTNRSGADLAFGVPVAMSPAGDGVVPFDPASHTGADFVGVTVRAPAKTPDSGKFAAGSGSDYVALPNVRISGVPDAGGMAELLLTGRAIL